MDLLQRQNKKALRDAAYSKLWERHSRILTRLDELQKLIGYRFGDITVLYEALTHRSALMELGISQSDGFDGLPWNERLEFLGDSVLGLAISRRLMERSEVLAEGELSRMRAALVNEHSLAGVARDVDLGSCFLLGRGEEKNGGRKRASLLADGLEALIGAVFVDGGFEAADAFVGRLFQAILDEGVEGLAQTDFKTMLQELTQERFKETPTYKVLSSSGPEHEKVFEVAVMIDQQVLGTGKGASKKRASQVAACAALQAILGN